MNYPKLTVVIPVYNAEKYLKDCIDSIISQNFKDYELLLIDDGSTDSSLDICRSYEVNDDRVRVLSKTNGGVSTARNMGLDEAKGDWIVFVDADDWLLENAFEVINKDVNANIIVTPYYEYFNNTFHSPYLINTAYLSSNDLESFIMKYLPTGLLKTVCGKFYRRELFEKQRFDPLIKLGEDTLFFIEAYNSVSTLFVDSYAFYVYRMFPKTLKYSQSIVEAKYALCKIIKEYNKIGFRIPNFEKDIFCDFKSTCQVEINVSPERWYEDQQLSSIYRQIKFSMTLEYRIRYALLSYPLLRRLRNFLNQIKIL